MKRRIMDHRQPAADKGGFSGPPRRGSRSSAASRATWVIALPSALGNQALLQHHLIQAKLRLSDPHDPYEQEADRIADAVVGGSEPTAGLPQLRGSASLQRKCACGGAASGGECEECALGRGSVQRKAIGDGTGGGIAPIVHRVLRSSGEPLDPATRAFMEPRFGQDFSDVRIHTGARATESARSIDALAYTVGRNVVFGAGQYAPVSGSGRRLLAHELAHVVQQGAAGSAPPARRGVADGSPSERASRKAFRAVATPQSKLGSPVVQRAMICSKPLEAPVAGWVANHSYIDDTGRNDCRGSGMVGNYAVQQLVSGNFLRGCAVKTDRSTDPGSFRPNMKPCRPKPGVTDVSRCLDTAFSMYANPSVYSNEVAAVAAGVGGVAGGLVDRELAEPRWVLWERSLAEWRAP